MYMTQHPVYRHLGTRHSVNRAQKREKLYCSRASKKNVFSSPLEVYLNYQLDLKKDLYIMYTM